MKTILKGVHPEEGCFEVILNYPFELTYQELSKEDPELEDEYELLVSDKESKDTTLYLLSASHSREHESDILVHHYWPDWEFWINGKKFKE